MRSALIPLDPDAPNADRFRPFQDFNVKLSSSNSGDLRALVDDGPMSVCKGIAVGGVMFRRTEAMNDLPSGTDFLPYQLSRSDELIGQVGRSTVRAARRMYPRVAAGRPYRAGRRWTVATARLDASTHGWRCSVPPAEVATPLK